MVKNLCGKDGTDQFSLFHPLGYLSLIFSYAIGVVDEGASSSSAPTPSPTNVRSSSLSSTPLSSGQNPPSPPVTLTPVKASAPPTQTQLVAPQTLIPTSLSSSIPEDTIFEATFSLSDVELHNTPSDCWTIYDRTVYDVTSYAPTHPGSK